MDQPAAVAPAAPLAAPQSAVQSVLTHAVRHKTPIGIFEVAALGTLLLVAFQGRKQR